MIIRYFLLPLFAVMLTLAAACFGGSSDEEGPTATPSPNSPVFQRQTPTPGAGSPTPSPNATTTSPAAGTSTPAPTSGATSPPVSVSPVSQQFQISVPAALNIRAKPSTAQDSQIVGAIYPGEKATVTAEAKGQEVEAGQGDLWYQVQTPGGVQGFVYAAFVTKLGG